MKIVADLHIHSHYSRATSKNLNFEHLTKWAQLKGVHVVGTGDIAHPGWLAEMKEKLEPAEEGLFRLKADYAQAIQAEVPQACQAPVRFMLAGEISSIYKKYDKVRKIHNVIFAPSLEAVEKTQVALEKIGNIRADGRPILGLDSRDLLELILEIDPQNYLIPAHIWTPWFAMLGSKSGFDSVEECFADLTPHIFALETGLSSDPPMNWRVSALDGYTLVSNSDAHSPPKLAREANLFETDLSYPAMFEALKTGTSEAFLGTIEFFPEEGKYHYDGHRKCGISWEPETTIAHQGLCSECGKPVTVGVMHRVETLADRPQGVRPERHYPFHSLIPLPEVLAEVHGVGPNSKKVQESYEALLVKLGSELSILQDIPLEELEQIEGSLLSEGIRRMRQGDINIAAGYDGQYGVLKLFEEADRQSVSPQLSLFGTLDDAPPTPKQSKQSSKKSKDSASAPAMLSLLALPEDTTQAELSDIDAEPPQDTPASPILHASSTIDFSALNAQQQEAVQCTDVPLSIIAGPGTGKTRTLTYRIAYLIIEKKVSPARILAITFTNKAAEEMADRLTALLGQALAKQIVIKTFHAFGTMILRDMGRHLGLHDSFSICSDQDRLALFKQIYPDFRDQEANDYLAQISAAKNQLLTPETFQTNDEEKHFAEIYRQYETILQQYQLVDFDDLILRVITLFKRHPEVLETYQNQFTWISVDEYQDINFAQYRLLRLLTAQKFADQAPKVQGPNLCVIGDPDQAIYGFRGAKREYFLTFQQDFPEARQLQLSQNYRSTQMILEASRQVIAKETETERLKIWTEFVDQTKLEIYQAPTDKAEAEYVVHQIERMVGGTSYFSLDSGRVDDDDLGERAFSDFAVLYRLNMQSRLLIEAFDRSGIPYQTVGGGRSFYEYKDIQRILAYLWYVYNPSSVFHLANIFKTKSSAFKPKTWDSLLTLSQTRQSSVWNILIQFGEGSLFMEKPLFTSVQKKHLDDLIPFLMTLREAYQARISVVEMIEMIDQFLPFQRGGKGQKKQEQTQAAASAEQIQELLRKAQPFENRLADFLEATVLYKETDHYDPRADRVTLMTLHAAKGLEFPVVFVVGCEDDLLPYRLPNRHGQSDPDPDVAEERRLFYVGLTRAQQKLILTNAKTRFLFGQGIQNAPSPFLSDIEQTLKDIKKMARRKPAKVKEEDLQLRLF